MLFSSSVISFDLCGISRLPEGHVYSDVGAFLSLCEGARWEQDSSALIRNPPSGEFGGVHTREGGSHHSPEQGTLGAAHGVAKNAFYPIYFMGFFLPQQQLVLEASWLCSEGLPSHLERGHISKIQPLLALIAQLLHCRASGQLQGLIHSP